MANDDRYREPACAAGATRYSKGKIGMGIDPEIAARKSDKILFVDAKACGLEDVVAVQGDSVGFDVTHAVDVDEALMCLARQRFCAILWCDAPDRSDALMSRLEELKPQDIFESASSPALICVLHDEDHEGVAWAMSQTSVGFIVQSQLRSRHGATILAAVIKRVAHDQLLAGAQQQLVSTEKFAAMGLLAAEVAHEINNPASFVISNLSVMIDYIDSFSEFVARAREQVRHDAPQLFERLSALAQEYEIGFLHEDLNELLRRNLHGMQRIHQIVQDLRFFLHDSHGETGWVNIDRLLETTLNLVRYEAKYRAQFRVDFCEDAEILSDANRLSQVFLNLLVNAIHSIEQGDVPNNYVTVITRREDQSLKVIIRDTGVGMSERVMEQIFEPFYTTKYRGDGSGLGLSISRDIVKALGGEISVKSQVGVGSEFTVTLPIRAPKFERDAQISGGFPALDSSHTGEQPDPDAEDS